MRRANMIVYEVTYPKCLCRCIFMFAGTILKKYSTVATQALHLLLCLAILWMIVLFIQKEFGEGIWRPIATHGFESYSSIWQHEIVSLFLVSWSNIRLRVDLLFFFFLLLMIVYCGLESILIEIKEYLHLLYNRCL